MAEPLESGAFRGVLFTSKDSKPYAYLVAVRVQQKKLIVLEAFFPDEECPGPTPRHREVRPERPGGRLMEARLKTALCLLALLSASGLAGAEENYLHQSVGVTMLVADPAVAADRLEAWAESEGGYTLYKSDERVSLRLPHPRLGGLRGFLERLSEDILEYSPQAVDLREQLARAQSSLASRRDILARNLALLDQADTAGTLAIEQELLDLIQEVENLQAAVQKLTVDRTFARVEIGLRFEQSALPEDIPSSFAWINEVSFRPFIQRGVRRRRGRLPLRSDSPERVRRGRSRPGRQLPGAEPGGPPLPGARFPERAGTVPAVLERGADVAPPKGGLSAGRGKPELPGRERRRADLRVGGAVRRGKLPLPDRAGRGRQEDHSGRSGRSLSPVRRLPPQPGGKPAEHPPALVPRQVAQAPGVDHVGEAGLLQEPGALSAAGAGGAEQDDRPVLWSQLRHAHGQHGQRDVDRSRVGAVPKLFGRPDVDDAGPGLDLFLQSVACHIIPPFRTRHAASTLR